MSTNNKDIDFTSKEIPKANRKVKDSVFRNIFSDPKNILDMYQVLHPEDKNTTADDINVVTLEHILTTSSDINDLGFMVGNHLLILVEAQTKWSVNILIRSLFYLAQSLKDYIYQSDQNYYGTAKVNIPTPELYVIYTGPERELPCELSLQKEFFQNQKTSIEVNLKIIYNKDYKETNNIFLQYMKFISVYYEMRSTMVAPKLTNVEAYNAYVLQLVTGTVDYCIANNIMKDYLTKHRAEVIDMMTALYNEEEVRQMENRSARAEGRAEGRFEAKVELVCDMLKAKFPIDDVVRLSKLPKEQVLKIAQDKGVEVIY